MKHNRASYVTKKCRCEVCTEANRAYREQQRRKAGVQPRPPAAPLVHGTAAGYRAPHNCRCDDCRAASAAVQRGRYAAMQGQPVPDGKHGTSYAYRQYGCRCDPCRDAESVRHRRWYEVHHPGVRRRRPRR